MRLSGTKTSSIHQYRGLGNQLYDLAGERPSLDLQFSDQKSLVDAATGSQPVTFTRTSSGTYVDSQGVLRTATTNLLVRSEEFDNASWTKTSCTIAANTAVAPDGTLTADQQTHTGNGPRLTIAVSGAVASSVYTLSFYAKQGTSSFASVSVYDSAVVGNRFWFNLSTGQVGAKSNISTGYSSSSHSMQSIGNGWYRCIAIFTNTSSSTITIDGISVVGNTDGALTPSVSGLTGLIWGAQLEQSSTVGEYVPSNTTFTSRASNATFYNSGGIIETAGVNVARDRAFLPDENGVMRSAGRLLLEPAATNLITYSEDFSNAAWSTSSTAVTTNTTTAPDGTTTADSLLETTAHLDHVLYATSPQTFTTATHSIYVKPNGRNNVLLRFYHAPNDWISSVFSLTGNGSVTQTSAGSSSAFTAVSRSIVNVGNGWYRVSMTATQSSRATFAAVVDLCTSSTPTLSAGNGSEAYTGDSTKGLYLWGAQFETGTVATSYIPTVASQVTRSADVSSSTANSTPRFDHNPTTGESLGLLVEEQRTNLLLRSEEFDNASWSKTLATVTANQTTAPDGTSNADKLIGNATIDAHYAQQNISGATSGISYTSSVFAKASELTRFELLHVVGSTLYVQGYDLSNGTLLTRVTAGTTAATGGFIQAVGNGWYRCGITQTSDGTTGAVRCTLRSGNSVSFDATSQGLFFWGAQLEAGAFPTSYIPTTTATVTRSADVASISGSNFSSWFNAFGGTVFCEADRSTGISSTSTAFSINDGGFNNRFLNLRQDSSSGMTVLSVTGGATDAAVALTLLSSSNKNRIAATQVLNNLATAANGSLGGVNLVVGIPVVTQANIGSVTGSSYYNGTIRRLTYWPQRLSNTTLQQITQ